MWVRQVLGVPGTTGDLRRVQHSRLHVSRHVQLCGLALALVVVLGLVTLVPLLRLVGAFLVVEGELEPAAAIVVLGGTVPFRALAAADIYRAGWAPTVVLV